MRNEEKKYELRKPTHLHSFINTLVGTKAFHFGRDMTASGGKSAYWKATTSAQCIYIVVLSPSV